MDTRFLESFINREHTVLGRVMRPFSLWHYVNLDFADSPFAGHAGEVDCATLILAARICSAAPDPALRILPPRLAWRDRLFMWRNLATHGRPLAVELAKFRAYQRDYFAPPLFWHKEGSRRVSSPWPLAIVARLMRYGHCSEFEAWSMPLGKAMWYQAALAEANGADPGLVGEEELNALKEAGWHVE